jgi:hypothetical protein
MSAQARPRGVSAPAGETLGTDDPNVLGGSGERATRDRSSTVSMSGEPSPPKRTQRDDRLGPGWLVLLLPIACCGGPLLIGAVAAAGALGWGVLGAGVAAVLTAAILVVRRRAGRRCASPPAQMRSERPATPRHGPRR